MDELHRTMGRLAAQIEILLAQQNELVDQSTDVRIQIRGILSEQEALREKLERDVLPDVEDYARLKQRGIGIITVVGAAGVALGTLGEKLVAAIFK